MDQMAERAWIFYIKFFRKRRSFAKQGFPLFFCIAPAAGDKGRALVRLSGGAFWLRFADWPMLLIDLRLLANITDKLFLSGTAIGKFKPAGYYWESFPRFASFDMMSGYVYTKTGDAEAMISCKKADEQSSSWGDRLFDGVYLAEFAFSREIIDECPLSCLNL